jgi:subtilisin family serine protease
MAHSAQPNDNHRRKLRRRLLLSALILSGLFPIQTAAADRPIEAPLKSVAGETLPNEYIVAYSDQTDAPDRMRDRLDRQGIRPDRQFRHALKGFSATLTPAQLTMVHRTPGVAYVVPDAVVHADAVQSPSDWGLDRTDQRTLPTGRGYTYSATGAGVSVYVIDSGIRLSHKDFGGRAVLGYTAIMDGRGVDDCTGHGTHVAGTIGGSVHGVAKDVRLVAVRVLGCDSVGTWAAVIAGIDWVTANHSGPSVANLSLGADANQAVDDAVARSTATGVTYSRHQRAGISGAYVFPGTTACNDTTGAPYRIWVGSPGQLPAAPAKVASGDFNGDGRSDLLALYDHGSGAAGLWVFPGVSSRTQGASVPYRVRSGHLQRRVGSGVRRPL